LRQLNESWSPSRRVRRDGRDHRHLDVVLAASLGPSDLCVDVGANVGTITATMVRTAPNARHVVVEPLPDLAARLAARFPSCEVHAVACSDHDGTEAFHRVVDRPTRSGLQPGQLKAGMTTEIINVPVTTLDGLLDGRRPRVIKIDVEGTELEVLRGARATLVTARPVVVFEHQLTETENDEQTRAIHALLTEAGYRVFDIDGEGPLDADALVATCRRGRVWNFLAISSRPATTGADDLSAPST
jgi:FkbM family methyltransferase